MGVHWLGFSRQNFRVPRCSFIGSREQEMANTRRTLECVPAEKFEWKPHEKSTSLGGLETHLANILALPQRGYDSKPRVAAAATLGTEAKHSKRNAVASGRRRLETVATALRL